MVTQSADAYRNKHNLLIARYMRTYPTVDPINIAVHRVVVMTDCSVSWSTPVQRLVDHSGKFKKLNLISCYAIYLFVAFHNSLFDSFPFVVMKSPFIWLISLRRNDVINQYCNYNPNGILMIPVYVCIHFFLNECKSQEIIHCT